MARPPIIQKLKHGRLLCGTVFRWFVDTWNWLATYVDNLKGDFEVDPKNGVIVVDRTHGDHPVIRLRKDRLPASKVYIGPFNPVSSDDGVVSGFEHCYFQVGGLTYHIADVESFSGSDCVVALKIPTTSDGGEGNAAVVTYADIDALAAAQNDLAFEVVPLFIIDGHRRVTVDLRAIPTFQKEEML